jgi:hypothetical protein
VKAICWSAIGGASLGHNGCVELLSSCESSESLPVDAIPSISFTVAAGEDAVVSGFH